MIKIGTRQKNRKKMRRIAGAAFAICFFVFMLEIAIPVIITGHVGSVVSSIFGGHNEAGETMDGRSNTDEESDIGIENSENGINGSEPDSSSTAPESVNDGNTEDVMQLIISDADSASKAVEQTQGTGTQGGSTANKLVTDGIVIKVYMEESNKIKEIPLEEYVCGVVAAEIPSSFEKEAIKAQAIAARTYASAKMKKVKSNKSEGHNGAYVCDTTHCQVYLSEEKLTSLKGSEWMKSGYLKIKEAVSETTGQLLYYKGELVEQPLFHSSSGDRTENSEDVFSASVPYLRSVDSSAYEADDPYASQSVSMSIAELESKLRSSYADGKDVIINASSAVISEKNEGGSVKSVSFGELTLTGRQVRNLCGLRSADFTISVNGDNVVFTTSGYGHGVGMSQYGANGMAKAGYTCRQILSHYYSGTEVK